MTEIDLEDLEEALDEQEIRLYSAYAQVGLPYKQPIIERAARLYLAQSRVTDAEKQAALDWFNSMLVSVKEVFKAARVQYGDSKHEDTIRAALMQQGREGNDGTS